MQQYTDLQQQCKNYSSLPTLEKHEKNEILMAKNRVDHWDKTRELVNKI